MISNIRKKKEVEIPSSLSEINKVTDVVMNFFRDLPLSKSLAFDIRLCLEESVINAVKYGNCCEQKIPVKVVAAFNDSELYIAVEDQGPGFDPQSLPDPTDEKQLDRPCGRGVYLVKHLMDCVTYNDKGNRVEMVKVYNKGESTNAD